VRTASPSHGAAASSGSFGTCVSRRPEFT
jgi:hypothetical protein